jgi:hypothetical protein
MKSLKSYQILPAIFSSGGQFHKTFFGLIEATISVLFQVLTQATLLGV